MRQKFVKILGSSLCRHRTTSSCDGFGVQAFPNRREFEHTRYENVTTGLCPKKVRC